MTMPKSDEKDVPIKRPLFRSIFEDTIFSAYSQKTTFDILKTNNYKNGVKYTGTQVV